MITSEQYNVHNIGRNHTTKKTKVTMTRFYSTSQFQCFLIIRIGYMDFMDMHQWFWVSRNDVNVNRDDVDRNFAEHVWQVEHTLNIVWIIQYRIKFVLT